MNSNTNSNETFTVGRRRGGAGPAVQLPAAPEAWAPKSNVDIPSPDRLRQQRKSVSLATGLGRLASVRHLRGDEPKAASGGPAKPGSSAPAKSATAAGSRASKHLKYGFSLKAREYIAIGMYEQAIQCSQKSNDIVGWSVALILLGDAEKAVDIMEAFIISGCLVTYQEIHTGINGVKFDYRQILTSIISSPGGSAVGIMRDLPPPTEKHYRETIEDICEVVDWEELHQWYLTAVLLHPSYSPPTNPWLRQFFGLYPSTPSSNDKSSTNTPQGRFAAAKAAVSKVLTRFDVENLLISNCSQREIHYVNAVVAFKLMRLRSCMRSATEILRSEPDDIQLRFIRCIAALQLGERPLVSEDSTRLMQSESMLVSTVGCSLATFGVPLAAAKAGVESFRSPVEAEQHYVYALCEYVHSLTLLQLGQHESAVVVAKNALSVAPKRGIGTLLVDVIVVACTVLEDPETLFALRAQLNAYHQLHIALSPRHGGGYANDSINQLSIDSEVGELLNPLTVSHINDVRQMIAIHTTTARSLFSFEYLREAWVEVSSAVGCVEEILGSAVFAMTDCAPHRVLSLGCNIGMSLLDKLIEDDDANSKTMTPEELIKQREKDDKFGDEVIACCREWARLIRDYHPKMVLGHAAIAQVSVASHDEDSMERAIALSEQFPDYIVPQNILSYALYSRHLIPDAIANAQKTLQRFPHAKEAATMMRAISGQEGTYTLLYRGVLPFQYGPGHGADRTTWRLWLAFSVTLINFIMIIGMFVCNLSQWVPFPAAAADTVSRVQVSTMVPFYVGGGALLYCVGGTFAQPTLVSVLLSDLHFRNTRLNRFLYSSRLISWVNVVNALQVSVLGNNFKFSSAWYTVLLYVLLGLLQFPYSSRPFFLRSKDEPKMDLPYWITLTVADFVVFLALSPIMFVAALIEPVMFILFLIRPPQLNNDFDTVSSDVVQRLLGCMRRKEAGVSRFNVTSGSSFFQIELMKWIFFMTHSDLSTMHLHDQQMEEDDTHAFPLLDLFDDIVATPLPMLPKYVALPAEMKAVLDEQRKKDREAHAAIVGEAKMGEGNLTGILSDVNDPDDLFNDDDLDELKLDDKEKDDDGFGAEIMNALNEEFAKLQTVNAAIKEAQQANAAAKRTAAPVANGATSASAAASTAQAEVRKLGDVGLYRENREKADLLASGPMVQRFQHNVVRRNSAVAQRTTSPSPGTTAATAIQASVGKRVGVGFAASTSDHPAPPTTTAGNRNASAALLKGSMQRKQSIFRREPDEPAGFDIDDDMDAKKESAAAPPAAPVVKKQRPSFGAALDSSGSSSSEGDDDVGWIKMKPVSGSAATSATAGSASSAAPAPAPVSPPPKNPSTAAPADISPEASEFSPNFKAFNSSRVASSATITRKESTASFAISDANTLRNIPVIESRDSTTHSTSTAFPSVSPPRGTTNTDFLVKSPAPAVSPSPAANGQPSPARPAPQGPFAAQLQRKQSSVVAQQSMKAELADEAQRRRSLKDAAAFVVNNAAAAAPQASAAVSKRQSIVHFSTESGTPDAQPVTIVDEPTRRSTSAPGTRQDLASLQPLEDDGTTVKAVNGNLKVKKLVEELKFTLSSFTSASGVSSSVGQSEATLQLVRKQLEAAKMKFVADLKKLGQSVTAEAFDTRRLVEDLFVEFAQEDDERAGNREIVMALLSTVTNVDFAAIIHSRSLVNTCLEKGRHLMLEILLVYRPILAQLTSASFASFLTSTQNITEKRCSVLLTLIEVAARSKAVQAAADALASVWQETLERVISKQQSVPGEDRRDIVPLLEAAFAHPFIKVSADREAADKQTLFSRACREGDLVTVKTLAEGKYVKQLHRVQSDGTNALQQAVARNHTPVVEYLLAAPLVQQSFADAIRASLVHAVPGKGNCLHLAKTLKRDPKLIELLTKYTPQDVVEVDSLSLSQSTMDVSVQVKPVVGSVIKAFEAFRSSLLSIRGTQRTTAMALYKAYESAKAAAAEKIELLPGPEDLTIFIGDVRSQLIRVASIIANEGDVGGRLMYELSSNPNEATVASANPVLFRALCRRFWEDAKLLQEAIKGAADGNTEESWFFACGQTCSTEILRELLALPGVKDATLEVQRKAHSRGGIARHVLDGLVSLPEGFTATNSATCPSRLGCVQLLLDNHEVLLLSTFRDDLKAAWQRLVAELLSQRFERNSESKVKKLDVVKQMLRSPFISVDVETEISGLDDHHTIFSRACSEGDKDVVALLVSARCISNPNRCQSDGNCALTTAIRAQRVEVIEYLVNSDVLKGILNFNINTPCGKPLDIARSEKVDPRITQILVRAGAR